MANVPVEIRQLGPRHGGRGCGCDPRDNHTCTAHAAHIDESETELSGDGIYSYDKPPFSRDDQAAQEPLVVVVSGPDRDGEIGILASNSFYLSRFDAEDLAHEILRRLAQRRG